VMSAFPIQLIADPAVMSAFPIQLIFRFRVLIAIILRSRGVETCGPINENRKPK